MITHSEKMRVNWVDTDASGLIHFTAALRYFEVAEHGLMRKLLETGLPGARGFGLPRVHVECDYRAPLRFLDEFQCTACVLGLGRSSVTYGYEARKDGVLCLEGKVVAVATDADGQSMPLPDEFRAAFERAL